MESLAYSDIQGKSFWGTQKEKLRSQYRNVGVSWAEEKGLHQRQGSKGKEERQW